MIAASKAKERVYAEIKGPDGKIRNLGRIDNKKWAPRAWFYRFVTFPLLKRKHNKERKT